jgi:hypothetical protein
MDTRLETEINNEAETIASVYGVRIIEAKIFLMKGITIYQEYTEVIKNLETSYYNEDSTQLDRNLQTEW